MSRARRRRPARIGLTPLIDVVFILLIFFMLASRFEDWRGVTLTAPGAGAAAPSAAGALLVEVRAAGLRLSGAPLDDAALFSRVRDRLADRPAQRVLVAPGPGVDTQRLVDVLDGLAAAGARDVALMGAP